MSHQYTPVAKPSDPVVVCGAGAAGLAAALAAARSGSPVCLLEERAEIGGTVTHALIHTLGGLYDSAGELVNDGLPGELASRLLRADPLSCQRQMGRLRVLNVRPETYARVVRLWVGNESRISVHCNARLTAVIAQGDRIAEVEFIQGVDRLRFKPRAVVDASGTAEVARLLDARMDHARPAAGGLIFTLRGVEPESMRFPQSLGVLRALQTATDAGLLPPECGKLWIDTGVLEDEVYVKLFVPLTEDWRDRESRGEFTRRARETRSAVIAFLRRLPGFARAVPQRTGVLGVRDGGGIRGDYCLTAVDVRAGRRFADAACRGCWPIEYWDPQDGVSIEYLPGCYDIPMRALKVSQVQNVWAAGKCISADRLAQASARVVGTCWAMGEAAGEAAARA